MVVLLTFFLLLATAGRIAAESIGIVNESLRLRTTVTSAGGGLYEYNNSVHPGPIFSDGHVLLSDGFVGAAYSKATALVDGSAAWSIQNGGFLIEAYGHQAVAVRSIGEPHPYTPNFYFGASASAVAEVAASHAMTYNGSYAYHLTVSVRDIRDRVQFGLTGETFRGDAFATSFHRSDFFSGTGGFAIGGSTFDTVGGSAGGSISDFVQSGDGLFDYRLFIVEVPYVPTAGVSQDNPIVTTLISANVPLPGGTQATSDYYLFEDAISGGWYDPPFTDSLYYQGVNESLFSAIRAPHGFGMLELWSLDGTDLLSSTFGNGEIHMFDEAVKGFAVRGFNPLFDIGIAGGFPLQVFFDGPTGSFAMSGTMFGSTSGPSGVPEATLTSMLMILSLLSAAAVHLRVRGTSRRSSANDR